MQDNDIHRLIERYLSGRATEQERETLMQWYRSGQQEDVVWESDSPDEADRVKVRIAAKIRKEIQAEPVTATPSPRRRYWKWTSAAVAAGLIGALWLFDALKEEPEALSPVENQTRTVVDTQQETGENRFILLPDSSKVILRHGSKLEYKAADFEGKTREVVLVGEGYFDIKRDESRPFIVHSGDIRTVVLGTAFTVKADEGQKEVKVTVQHGKVRVEKQEEILAELEANQQLEVDTRMAVAEQKKVVAEETLAWTAEDMRFDNETFGLLIERLQRRYGVEISFKNPALAMCPVSGRFMGTEELDEVLGLLCTTRNAKYARAASGKIEIDGPGCQ